MSAEYLRNGAFTPSYASPQLIQHVGSGRMPVMDDVANDMWALGAVLFELSTSTERGWTQHYGPFMFGPRPKDIKRCNKGGMDQRISRTRKAIQKEHDLWVRSHWQAMHTCPALFGPQSELAMHLQSLAKVMCLSLTCLQPCCSKAYLRCCFTLPMWWL